MAGRRKPPDGGDERTGAEFPEPQPGPARDLLALRLACSLAMAAAFTALFWDVAASWAALLWPPRAPLSRWVALVFAVGGGYVLVPGVVGTLLADRLYARYR